MSVSEAIMAPGSWSIALKPDTPRSITDALSYFQHVVIATGRHNPVVEGAGLFSSGRYAGVITSLDFQSLSQGRGPTLSGDGMASWLGNASGVGPVIEGNNTPGSSANGAQFTSASYASVVTALTPSSLAVGTVYSMPSSASYTGGFVWQLPSKALTSFATQITQGPLPTQIAEWRVNNNCTLDFGPVASLYRTSPTVAIVSKNAGVDMSLRGLDGVAELVEDVKDYTTRVVVLASGQSVSTAIGVANSADVGASNPYTDFFGNPVKMTRLVSASSVSSLNANVSAQAALIPYTTPADQVRLSSSEYDIKGDLQVGDYVWLYDPDAGFVDPVNEIVYRGQRINPTKQRVIQADWPVTSDMTVAYRDGSGNWYDLTDYVMFEDGNSTNLIVGGYNRNLVSSSEPVGARPQPDNTIPGSPVFGAFSTATYQGASDGRTRAQIRCQWSTPANTDGTTMVDLSHYEVRYRPNLSLNGVNPTYAGLNTAGYTYATLAALGGTYASVIPQAVADWKVTFVAGGVNQLLVQELTPAVSYDFQVRAVDTANPPNYGSWSADTLVQASVDIIPPPTPNAPTVAANLVSLQVTWDCGSASGGSFTQAVDLHHVEIHGSYEPLFIPVASTKLGNLPANIGNITGQIPVVGSFTLPPSQPPASAMYIKLIAVDEAGNKSNPSAAAGATAVLWSDAYVTDLSVSKLTAGTVTASIILGGTISTASAGQRCVMDYNGFHGYDTHGNLIFDVNDSNPVVTLGKNGTSTASVTVDTSISNPVIFLNPASGNNYAFINAVNLGGGGVGLGANGGTFTSRYTGGSVYYRMYLTDTSGAVIQCVDTTQTNQGGVVAVYDNQVYTGFVAGGSTVGQYSIGSNGRHTAIGTYNNFVFAGTTDAWFTGALVANANSLSVSYGPTMASAPYPLATVMNGAGGAWSCVTAFSTTGFTIGCAVSAMQTFNFLCLRM